MLSLLSPIEKTLDGLLGVAKIILSSKSEGKELKKKLSPLKAVVDEISKKISDSDSLSDRLKQYEDFQAELNNGLRLVDKLEKIHSLNLFGKYRYGTKVRELLMKIKDFMDIQGSPYVVRDVQNLTAGVRGLECQILDAIPKMNNNPISNTLILQQINTTQLSQTSIDRMDEPMDAQQSIFCTFQGPDMPNYVVGLDNPIADVGQILLQDDNNIVGVTGMGGSGKTTLALALCNDLKVGTFPNVLYLSCTLEWMFGVTDIINQIEII